MKRALKGRLFDAAKFVEALNNQEAGNAMRLLDKANNLSRQNRQDIGNEAFLDLLKNTVEYVPFYRSYFSENGLSLSHFKSIEDIDKLPIITKDILKQRRSDLISENPEDDHFITRTSGGTTGEPVAIEVNKQSSTNDVYFYYRGLQWMGWKPGYPMVKFFGGSMGGNNTPTLKNKIKKLVSGEVFIPAFDLNNRTAERVLKQIKNLGPCYLQGYVSSIYSLANYARDFNFKGLKIKGAFTTAEQLPVEQADFISEVFSCEVKAFYGCAEINNLGYQINQHGYYRVSEEIVFIENKDSSNFSSGSDFLVSSLWNKRMPLLRYQNGDSGELGIVEDHTAILELSGRTADRFYSNSRGYISSIVATQTMQITGLTHKVKRYQLVQLDESNVEFRYCEFENEKLQPEELNKIIGMYKKRIGDDLRIVPVQTVDFIKSSSGKHRLMINLSNKPK